MKTSAYIFLLFAISSFSCGSVSKNDLTGRYESNRVFVKRKPYAIGEVLQLNKDSSFYYEGCGQTAKGIWKTDRSGDTILLYCSEFNYRNDSLNDIRKPSCDPSVVFEKYKIRFNGDLIAEYPNFYTNFERKN